MKYRIWNKKISQIVEAESMGAAYYQARDSFSGDYNVERLDNWDTEEPGSSSGGPVHIGHILKPIKEKYVAELQRRKEQRGPSS